MTETKVYEMLLELIKSKASNARITDSELNNYFVPEGILFKQNYLQRLASSLQNSGMMHNSIRFNESKERYDHIKKVLCDFDAKKVLKKYNDWKDLYDALTNKGDLDNGTQKDTNDKKTNWGKYAKGLYDGVVFLEKKDGNQMITNLCESPVEDYELVNKIEEIKKIEKNIHGLGFALVCDWLKECGCTWLAKPDTHIKIVCSAISKVIDPNKVNAEMTDIDIIKFVFKFAKGIQPDHPDATAYKLDKIIWLICTGNFYLQKDKIGRETILSKLKN